VLSVTCPAVISADLRLNQPRYLTLQGSAQAVKKEIETCSPQSLKVEIRPRLKNITLAEPPIRKAGVILGSVEELIERLHSEAEVI
jgi:electron transfer flavoprotein beta subunit